MNSPASYSPGWEAPSHVQTPLSYSHHPFWNSHSPLELDPFVQNSLQSDTSYPAANLFTSPSDSQTSMPIYYNTFHGQYSNAHPHHGILMHPNYSHPMAYMTLPPLPLQNAHSTVLNAPEPASFTAHAQNKHSATMESGTAAHMHKKHKTNTTTQLVPEAQVPEPEPSPQCGIGPSVVPSAILLDAPLVLAPQLTGEFKQSNFLNANLTICYKVNALGQSNHSDPSTLATNVWFFLCALYTPNKPEVLPTNELILMTKPSTKFIGCKLCT